MILHLLRMRRNVNRNVFNDRKNVSATPSVLRDCIAVMPAANMAVAEPDYSVVLTRA